MPWYTVNRKLLLIKFHYALSSGMVTVQPALPVYIKILRFSTFVLGTISTILPILGIFIKPAFATIADKFQIHRAVLIAWEIIMLASFFLIQFIPAPDITAKTESFQPNSLYAVNSVFACTTENASPYFLVEADYRNWSCDGTEQLTSLWNLPFKDFSRESNICEPVPFTNSIVMNTTQCKYLGGVNLRDTNNTAPDNTMDDADTFKTWQFWVYLLLLLGTTGGTQVVSTLSDTICYEICGNAYGRQRYWASLYWGVVAIINGFIIDAVSTDGEDKNYTPAFYMMLVPLLIDVVITYNLKFEMPKRSDNLVQDVGKSLLKLRSLFFMFWCIMVGVSFGLLWNFLFWLLEDLATANNQMSEIKTIEGFVTGIQSLLGEAPAFFMGGWVVSKVGYGHSISLVLLFIGLRFTFYSILGNPWWCLPIELLQNDYGLFYSTMTSFAKKVALPGTEATMQSVYCVSCEGVGVAIGSFIGGVIYKNYGGSTSFRIFGIFFLSLAAVNELIEFCLRTFKNGIRPKTYAVTE